METEYKEILEITKDESVARGVVQAMMLTGLGHKEILRSMGFKIERSEILALTE